MRALSIRQPDASLFASGGRRYETRSWKTDYRGWVAIAASARFPLAARARCEQPVTRAALAGRSMMADPSERWWQGTANDLPLGAVVAMGELVDCVPTARVMRLRWDPCLRGELIEVAGVVQAPHEFAFGIYTAKRYAWVFRNVLQLARPVPVTGRLGLFTLPADVATSVTLEIDRTIRELQAERWRSEMERVLINGAGDIQIPRGLLAR